MITTFLAAISCLIAANSCRSTVYNDVKTVKKQVFNVLKGALFSMSHIGAALARFVIVLHSWLTQST